MSDALYVHGAGHFHPDTVIDNRFLEELDIGTTDAWILERTGIRERRTVLPLDYLRKTRNADPRAGEEAATLSSVETGRRAALHALERAALAPRDIGLVVAGGCCPSMCIPPEACLIAAALGIDAPALDIGSACSSFGAQLHALALMRELPRFVLVVNAENTTRTVDYRDRSTAVLWGDGASAAVVSGSEPSRLAVTHTTLASAPRGSGLVTIPRFGHFAQEGSAVQRFAIKTTLACLEPLLGRARERAARTGGRVLFIGHQANALMLDAVARRAEVPAECHLHNVERFGNTGAAGAPAVLSQSWERLRAGDTVLLAVVGSGLTWSSLMLEVA